MPIKPEDSSQDKLPERPLECTECKKPIAVHYTEIVGDVMTHTCMCSDCPILQKKLHGQLKTGGFGSAAEGGAGLACGECGTTLDSVRVGGALGCSNCYEVFDDVLIHELMLSGRAPPRLATNKKSLPYHIGRNPGEFQEFNPSLRLLALNEELNETLKREDYEQAAMLRDQIKALTDKQEKAGDQGQEKKDER